MDSEKGRIKGVKNYRSRRIWRSDLEKKMVIKEWDIRNWGFDGGIVFGVIMGRYGCVEVGDIIIGSILFFLEGENDCEILGNL